MSLALSELPESARGPWSRRHPLLVDALAALLVLVVGTVLFRVTNLDLTIAGHYFAWGPAFPGANWPLGDSALARAVYKFGTLPALLLGVAGLFGALASRWVTAWRPYWRVGLFVFLFVLIGPGLVVNVVFKDHWGRPRPREVVQFGGARIFLPVWQKGPDDQGGSFPSGHASMGFALMAPYFWLRRRVWKQAVEYLLLGLVAGLILGYVRIIQGGHFASDVLWAFGFDYLCGLGLFYLLRFPETSSPE